MFQTARLPWVDQSPATKAGTPSQIEPDSEELLELDELLELLDELEEEELLEELELEEELLLELEELEELLELLLDEEELEEELTPTPHSPSSVHASLGGVALVQYFAVQLWPL